MEKYGQLIIATLIILYLLLTNETNFRSLHAITLFLTLFLFNLLFNILLQMYYRKPIKAKIVTENIKETLIGFVIYHLLLDVLTGIPEMKTTVKFTIISFVIALVTKQLNKYYSI